MKGSLTSREANEAARQGVLCRWPQAEVCCVAVSDGGEGFVDAVSATAHWQTVEVEVMDPLMRPVRARYLIYKHRAVVEMAQASGLGLLRPEERNPLVASSYGTGQLIADALRHGATDITVGLGGSATSDCGRGMLEALHGRDVAQTSFFIATDVANPLLGPEGAAHVFAPQKGATPEMVDELERRAHDFARESQSRMGYDCSMAPGAGAAGGVGYAMMQYMGARRVSGVDYILDLADFDGLLADADLVITGEGRADCQTLMGKLPQGVLRRAQGRAVPVLLLAGQVADSEALSGAGFSSVVQVTPPGMPIAEALRPEVARRNICEAVARWSQ